MPVHDDSQRTTRVERHLRNCSQLAGAALLAAGAMAAIPATPADAALYTGTAGGGYYYYGAGVSTGGPPTLFFNVDYAAGTIGIKYSSTYGPGDDFTVTAGGVYAAYEFAMSFGSFGPEIFDNKGDTKALYFATTDPAGGFMYPGQYAYGATFGTGGDQTYFTPVGTSTTEFTSFNSYWPYIDVAGGDKGVVGFKFYDSSTLTSTYGWFYFSYVYENDGVKSGFNIDTIQWDSTAASITAGVVPEPTSASLALMAAGAAGLAGWRRRRQEQAD